MSNTGRPASPSPAAVSAQQSSPANAGDVPISPSQLLDYIRADVRDGHDVSLTNSEAALILALIDELSRRVAR